MTPREQSTCDALHDVADEGPWCDANGIPAQYCPAGCSHDAETESLRAEAECEGLSIGRVAALIAAENAAEKVSA
jgi:hypothetical protein